VLIDAIRSRDFESLYLSPAARRAIQAADSRA
jgi:hypothetical protein